MTSRFLFAAALLAAAPAFAQDAPTGDAAAGEAAFRQCATCHHVVAPDGTVLAGRENVRTGPNLFGIVGRTAGTYPDFRYGDSIVAAGAAGLAWNEADFVAYVQDPGAFLKDKLGDASARSNMTYKVRKPEDAADLWAYLASLAPATN